MTATALPRPPGQRLLPNTVLAAACLVLALAALAAILRGAADWGRVPPLVWVHLGSVLLATLVAPTQLLRRKGSRWHRRLGYLWAAAMLAAAGTSLFFSSAAPGGLGVFTGDVSPIHILSVLVLVAVPRLVLKARARDHVGHENSVRAIVIGGLLIAGFFTFPFDRLLGRWLLA